MRGIRAPLGGAKFISRLSSGAPRRARPETMATGRPAAAGAASDLDRAKRLASGESGDRLRTPRRHLGAAHQNARAFFTIPARPVPANSSIKLAQSFRRPAGRPRLMIMIAVAQLRAAVNEIKSGAPSMVCGREKGAPIAVLVITCPLEWCGAHLSAEGARVAAHKRHDLEPPPPGEQCESLGGACFAAAPCRQLGRRLYWCSGGPPASPRRPSSSRSSLSALRSRLLKSTLRLSFDLASTLPRPMDSRSARSRSPSSSSSR